MRHSIPDAFTVVDAGSTKFTTGGLVSGAGAASISINGEPVVFVSISAPEDGTAWDYTMGCL